MHVTVYDAPIPHPNCVRRSALPLTSTFAARGLPVLSRGFSSCSRSLPYPAFPRDRTGAVAVAEEGGGGEHGAPPVGAVSSYPLLISRCAATGGIDPPRVTRCADCSTNLHLGRRPLSGTTAGVRCPLPVPRTPAVCGDGNR